MGSLARAARLTVPREVAFFEAGNDTHLLLKLSPYVMMSRGGWLARRWSDEHGDINLTWIIDQSEPPVRQVWLVSRFNTPPPEAGEAIAPLFFVNETFVMVIATLQRNWPPGLAMKTIHSALLQLPTFPEEN